MKVMVVTSDSPERLHGFRVSLSAFAGTRATVAFYDDERVVVLVPGDGENVPPLDYEEERLTSEGFE